ncbi:MAG: tyrosine--tRNA ligase [Actinomycetota bacterium]
MTYPVNAPLSPVAEEQYRALSSGVDRIVPDAEFRAKLHRSIETGVPLRVKFGIDPSSPDIHIGHAVPLRVLRRFQSFGHTAVLIIGDYTGRVGDPTGRNETRKALTAEQVDANATTYLDQVGRILLPEPLEIVRNSTWLGALGTDGMLKLAGQMTVARMLERDDFAKRYASGQPISIVEFCYPLLQGYDSVAGRSDVELGGSDQLFNLLVGRDLQSRDGQSQQVAFTLPLLEGLDGTLKMSKSYGNYVGVAEPADEMYGKLMSVPDSLLGKYLRLATDLPLDEVERVESSAKAGGKAAADAKRRLALEVTTLYHDTHAATAAADHFNRVHVDRSFPDEIPIKPIPADAIEGGLIALPRLLAVVGLAASTSKARSLIEGGAVRIDGETVSDPKAAFDPATLVGKVLQAGKRAFVRIG